MRRLLLVGAGVLLLGGCASVMAEKAPLSAQATLKDSAARLSKALARARRRKEVAAQIARAQVTLRTSMRRLSRNLEGSRKTVESQVRLLTRGLKAGIRAGSAAYRRPRG